MRYFTLVDFPEDGKTSGRYSGKSPRRAASKAFTQLCKVYNFKNSMDKFNYIKFSIREVGQNSNKVHTYMGTRVKLYKPITVNRDNKIIRYKYKNIITEYKG